MFDGVAFGKQVVAEVRELMRRTVEPMQDRIDTLEALIRTFVPRSELPDVRPVVAEEVARAVDALPPAKDGKSVTVDDVRPVLEDLVTRAVGALPPAKDGKSVTFDDVRPMLEDLVARAVGALPPAKDGKSVTVDDVRPVLEDLVTQAVGALPPAKDGVGLADAVIGRNGQLVVTLSNGATRDLGTVVGKEGEPGLGFDDLDVVYDGAREFTLRFVKGERQKEFKFALPVMIYQGVYQGGKTYERGDTATWGGSLWHCDQPTSDKPDGQSKSWTLAAKRGRDGKDAK